jgi:hypothetical protein
MVMKSEALAPRTLAVLGIVSLVFLAGCGGGTASTANPTPNPNSTPTITTISPNTTGAGSAAFTLTITGTNFVAASMVNFGGAAATTTFENSTQLTAAIPAASVASAGSIAVTAVLVRSHPKPGKNDDYALAAELWHLVSADLFAPADKTQSPQGPQSRPTSSQKVHSKPMTARVRRKRQRLRPNAPIKSGPESLLSPSRTISAGPLPIGS